MKLFAKILYSWKPLTIFTKSFILDVWLGSDSACDITRSSKFMGNPLENIYLNDVSSSNFIPNLKHNFVRCSIFVIVGRLVCTMETGIYLFKVNNGNTKTMCEIYSKLKIRTIKPRRWRCWGVSIVSFEHLSQVMFQFSI